MNKSRLGNAQLLRTVPPRMLKVQLYHMLGFRGTLSAEQFEPLYLDTVLHLTALQIVMKQPKHHLMLVLLHRLQVPQME